MCSQRCLRFMVVIGLLGNAPEWAQAKDLRICVSVELRDPTKKSLTWKADSLKGAQKKGTTDTAIR